MTEQVDELFDVKLAFYIGAFQQCIKNCQTARLSDPALAVEKDAFMYRAYLAQRKFAVILDEIKPSAPKSLQHLRTLATYLQAPAAAEGVREAAVKKIEGELNSGDSSAGEDHLLYVVAATIFMHEKNYDAALRALNSAAASNNNLEVLAMQIQAYLVLDRVDFAKKALKQMQDIDDDSVLTQLAQAWCNIAMGGEKSKDAYFAFQELADKSKSTPLLLNGQVCAFLAQGMLVEAEAALNEAMDIDANNYDTLVNQVVFNQLSGKDATRLITQLKAEKEDSGFVAEYKQKEADFERLCQNYQASSSCTA